MSDKGERGRPTKLTPEMSDRIVNSIRAGNFPSVVCRAAGVGRRTYKRWLSLGKKFPDGIYGAFRHRVWAARAEFEEEAVQSITNFAKSDPDLMLKVLACTSPDRWGGYRSKLDRMESAIVELKAQLMASAGMS